MLNMAVEEIAKACASSALILMIQELGTLPIRLFGSDELKERFLPEMRLRRVEPGVRAVGARRRLGPGRHAHQGRARRRRVGDRRHQELDHQPRRRRLLHLLRGHQPRRRPLARNLRIRGRGRPRGLLGRQARAQDGDPRIAHRPADLRQRPRPAREPDRRGRPGLQGGDGNARPLPARRRRAGRRHRAGRDRLRRRLRPGASAVRQADRRVPGHPVQARRHGVEDGRRPRAALPRLLEDRRRRRATWASTRRWPS